MDKFKQFSENILKIREDLNENEVLLTNYINTFKLSDIFEEKSIEYCFYDMLKQFLNKDKEDDKVLKIKTNFFKAETLKSFNSNINKHFKNFLTRNIIKKIENFYNIPEYSLTLNDPIIVDLTKHSGLLYVSEDFDHDNDGDHDNDDDDNDDDDNDDDDNDDDGDHDNDDNDEKNKINNNVLDKSSNNEITEEKETTEENKNNEEKETTEKILNECLNDEELFNKLNDYLQNSALKSNEDREIYDSIFKLMNTDYVDYDEIPCDFVLWLYTDNFDTNPVDILLNPDKNPVSKNSIFVHIKSLNIKVDHQYNKLAIMVPISLYNSKNLRTKDTHPNIS